MSVERVITVFSTKGKQKTKVTTDVATWAELKPLLFDEGYDLSNLLATENVKRRDLVNDTAELPVGDFTVFLRPEKTKSGLDVEGLSFSDLRLLVKDRKEDKAFMAHVGNYTRLSTEALREKLTSWEEDETEAFEKALTEHEGETSGCCGEISIVELIESNVKIMIDNEEYSIKLQAEECGKDCQETKALVLEAEELLKGFK